MENNKGFIKNIRAILDTWTDEELCEMWQAFNRPELAIGRESHQPNINTQTDHKTQCRANGDLTFDTTRVSWLAERILKEVMYPSGSGFYSYGEWEITPADRGMEAVVKSTITQDRKLFNDIDKLVDFITTTNNTEPTKENGMLGYYIAHEGQTAKANLNAFILDELKSQREDINKVCYIIPNILDELKSQRDDINKILENLKMIK